MPMFRYTPGPKSQQNGLAAFRQKKDSRVRDGETLLACSRAGETFRAADLGPTTFPLVESLHRLISAGHVDSVPTGGGRWVYRVSDSGKAEVQHMLAGNRYRSQRSRCGPKRKYKEAS